MWGGGKHCCVRHTTVYNIILRMRITCWILKATNTHTHNMQYLSLFHCNNGYTDVSQCYVTRILPVWLRFYKQLSKFSRVHFNNLQKKKGMQ